ncbi:hypothetical protein Tcan_09367 [Toxocara canis]|uniref:Uncharacterized protein n=1 Tax=Toxocara canis TaxID=6265 RepID=A0A0B2VAV0_TOXCA|nr:hypothetical protein Tcan_09367 [Toxocara canis]
MHSEREVLRRRAERREAKATTNETLQGANVILCLHLFFSFGLFSPEAIAEHLLIVQAVIDSELGEGSLRDPLDPVDWLDAQTIYLYLEPIAAASPIRALLVPPFIWMFSSGNAQSVTPHAYVRHYIHNYVDG